MTEYTVNTEVNPDELNDALRCARSHLIKGTLLGDAETRLLACALLEMARLNLRLTATLEALEDALPKRVDHAHRRLEP